MFIKRILGYRSIFMVNHGEIALLRALNKSAYCSTGYIQFYVIVILNIYVSFAFTVHHDEEPFFFLSSRDALA